MEKNIDIERALELLEKNIAEKQCIEEIEISRALGKILAQNVYSTISQPPFSKSAMDGYALNSADLDNCSEFTIQSIIYAGDGGEKNILKNHCYRIMTGGKIPENCDIVIRQEDCERAGEKIKILKYNIAQRNICYKGEEYKENSLLLKKNKKLNYIDLGILSSAGINKINVKKDIKIALLITGDEVVKSGLELEDGKIFDANGMLLKSRLQELGYSVVFMEYFGDDENKIKNTIDTLVKNEIDLIITTGGVSVGEKDIFHNVYQDIERIFWRVNLKPGTPVMFGKVGKIPILSLSGNPFASLVTFEIFARKIISILQGDKDILPQKIIAVIDSDFFKKSDKLRFIRGEYKFNTLKIPQGLHTSSSLINLQNCNVLVEIPANEIIKKGDEVRIWVL